MGDTYFQELFLKFIGVDVVLMVVVDLREEDLNGFDDSGVVVEELSECKHTFWYCCWSAASRREYCWGQR